MRKIQKSFKESVDRIRIMLKNYKIADYKLQIFYALESKDKF